MEDCDQENNVRDYACFLLNFLLFQRGFKQEFPAVKKRGEKSSCVLIRFGG